MILAICPNPSVDKFLHIPEFIPGSVNRSGREEAFPGGKGIHVALALAELGVSTKLVGIWGGPTGRWIIDECKKKGVPCFGPETPGWTRTCLTLKTDLKNSDTEILEQGPKISESEITQMFDIISEQLYDAVAVSVSGSWPPGTSGGVYKELKKLTSKRDIPLWIDASGERLHQAVQVRPYGIHINMKEAHSLLKEKPEPAKTAIRLLEFCEIAAVSDGANGLFLAKDGRVLHAFCPVRQVISTVGCGDCLLAGLLQAGSKSQPLNEMAVMGTACGAANCVSPGLGMLKYDDVKFFLPKVTCNKVN